MEIGSLIIFYPNDPNLLTGKVGKIPLVFSEIKIGKMESISVQLRG